MKKEIERRFLVDPKKLPRLDNGHLLTQGYLTKIHKTTDPIVRVRLENRSATLTIKLHQTDLTKDEFEYKIPFSEGQKLISAALALVQKIRYSLKIGKDHWVVDCYEGENFPLVVAEIELKSEKEKFEKPLWIKKEVSYDHRFHAYSLAFQPFNSWKKSR